MACSAPNILAVRRYDNGYNKTVLFAPYDHEEHSKFFRERHFGYIGPNECSFRHNVDSHVTFHVVGCYYCRACRKLRSLHMATRCYLEMK